MFLQSLTKTFFYTSSVTFLVYGLFEYIRPGFVSRYFPFHWLLLIVLISAIWWGKAEHDKKDNQMLLFILAATTSLTGAVIVWQVSGDLKEYRLLVSCLTVLIPFGALSLLKKNGQ